MKKTISVVFLFMLFVTLLALESEPSETVGYVRYDCVTNTNGNYNFIALPLAAGYTTASELGTDYPALTSVRQWDQTNQIWVASDNYGGGFWSPDNAINPNEALYVTVNSNTSVYIAGGLNDPAQYSFVTNANGNYNTMMLPFEKSDLLESDDLGEDIGVCTSVRRWDNSAQNWVASDNYGGGFWSPTYSITTAYAYYITVFSNTTWPTSRGIIREKLIQNLSVEK